MALLRVSAYLLRSLSYIRIYTTLKTPFSLMTSPLQLVNAQTPRTIDWNSVTQGAGETCVRKGESAAFAWVTVALELKGWQIFMLGHGANTHMHRPMCMLLVNETLQKSPGAVTESICSLLFDNLLLLTLTAFSFLNLCLFYCFLDHRPERNQSEIWPERTGICHQNTPPEISSLVFLLYAYGLQHSGRFKPFGFFTWKYTPISSRGVLDNTT